jgi:hypothetical protein
MATKLIVLGFAVLTSDGNSLPVITSQRLTSIPARRFSLMAKTAAQSVPSAEIASELQF